MDTDLLNRINTALIELHSRLDALSASQAAILLKLEALADLPDEIHDLSSDIDEVYTLLDDAVGGSLRDERE